MCSQPLENTSEGNREKDILESYITKSFIQKHEPQVSL